MAKKKAAAPKAPAKAEAKAKAKLPFKGAKPPFTAAKGGKKK